MLAREAGKRLAAEGHELVFGGAACGMMGILAQSVYDAGGRITGVYPGYFEDLAHHALHEHVVSDDIRERKKHMQDLAEAFIVLPGG